MTSAGSHYRKLSSVMKQLRGTYSAVGFTATFFADNIKLRHCVSLSESHNNAELLNCPFKKFSLSRLEYCMKLCLQCPAVGLFVCQQVS